MADERIEELARSLKPRERKFVEVYLANGWNGTKAALEAQCGKNEQSAAVAASRMLKREQVRAYIAARTKEIYAQLCLSGERLAAEYIRLYQRATKAVPVMVWDSDEKAYVKSGEYQYDAQTALKVLDKLGEHTGMFVQKAEAPEVRKGALEGLTTDELRALIRAVQKPENQTEERL